MIKAEGVARTYGEAEGIFWERQKKYGTKGMNVQKALALAGTKLDRLMNAGSGTPEYHDSAVDLMNYGLILALLGSGEWKDSQESLSLDERVSEAVQAPQDATEAKGEAKATLLVKRTDAAKAFPIPHPQKDGDVGYDLHTVADAVLPPYMEFPIPVPTETSVKIPDGYWALVINRSSTAKLGIDISLGVIDTGYTGPLYAMAWNRTGKEITVRRGDRLAQFLLLPATVVESIDVEELPKTARGATGFGSTGK